MILFKRNGEYLEFYELIPNFEKISQFRKKEALKLNLKQNVFNAICCDENAQVLIGNEIIFYNTLVHPGKYVGCWHHDFKNYVPNEDESDEIIEVLINESIKDYREVKAVINGEVETIKYLFLLKPKYIEQIMEVYKMSRIVEVSKEFYIINKLLNVPDVSYIGIEDIYSTISSCFDVSFKEKKKILTCEGFLYDEENLQKSELLLSILLQ